MDDSFEGSNAALLDALLLKLNLKNDAELCRAVDMQPSAISKLRTDTIPIWAKVLLRFHEASGISIRELKSYLPEAHWSARSGFKKATEKEYVDMDAIARADEISDSVINRLRVEKLLRFARAARAGDFGGLSTTQVGKGYISAVPMAAKALNEDKLSELTKKTAD